MKYLLLWSGDVKGMRKAEISAVRADLSGHLDEKGEIVRPCPEEVRAALPYRFRHAFGKSTGMFWFLEHKPDYPATLTVRGYRGRELVRLVLQPLRAQS
ncbi:hypothetical protein IWQ55_000276 [Labrenzia sp. EL_208]|nr:hypothetical protein [Labrenzia sp. EL_132]MBG6227084.1 hypothetical protein [Labrenzia sp. EL_208]